MLEIKKVPVKVVAEILGKSEQFVRCGLRYERFNFGFAVCTNPHKRNATYSYHISPKKFMDYAGCDIEDILSTAKRLGVSL